ncbi:Carbamate kinase-like protein YqeA [Bienertia sinuspersici]
MASSIHHHYYYHPLLLHSSTKLCSPKSLYFDKFSNSHLRNSLTFSTHVPKMPLTVALALTQSDSQRSFNSDPQALLQELANNLDLPPDYFATLPNDLRLDLNDAAFDLSNGPVIDECGQELGETLLNLARAWESADSLTSSSLAKKLPSLETSLTEGAKSALGKRLQSAGRRFQSMGQYGQGELDRIAKSMISAGKLLSETAMPTSTEERSKDETRTFKFGELQVELTPEKANVGAVIAVGFAILSWQVSQGIQSTPENSLQYANENAMMLAKSLRVFLLVIFYSSTLLSGFASIGLALLSRQLKSKGE